MENKKSYEQIFLEDNQIFKILDRSIPSRDIKSFNLDAFRTKDEPLAQMKKKTKGEMNKLLFEADSEQKYIASLFYRIYYSDSDRYMQLFKDLKRKLKDYKINFPNKNSDQSIIIVLEKFFRNLIENDISFDSTEQCLEIFNQTLNKDEIESNEIRSEDFEEFMLKISEIVDATHDILKLPMHKVDELTFNFQFDYDLKDELNQIDEAHPLTELSDTDPTVESKPEINIAKLQSEETLAKFKAEEANLDYSKFDSKKSAIQNFNAQFGPELAINESYFDNLLVALDLLQNDKKKADDLIDPLRAYLDDNFDAALYLIQNREKICEELGKAKDELNAESKKKKEFQYAKISGNLIIAKKNQKKKPQVNLQLLTYLGIDDPYKANDVQEEEIDRENNDDYDEYLDYMEESEQVLAAKFGIIRKERGLTIIFDVQPAHKSEEYKQVERIMIKDAFKPPLVSCFDDSDSLNALQSYIFNAVYNTDDNLLCCAPTGAGKTNVALMAVIRLVEKSLNSERNQVDQNFKVVYISPLKALASEIVSKFEKKLGFLKVRIREFTGDMSLSKKDLAQTHIIVSTPEKWDVATRKSEALSTMLNLLILDEIHLLDEERGRVLESLVARTSRLIESRQCRIRLIGLSATLPNYKDVAKFLRVPKSGLFYFDESYRPVPLYKKFIGIKKVVFRNKVSNNQDKDEMRKMGMTQLELMNETAYDLLRENLKNKKQVLIFVHSRKETINLAKYFQELAQSKGEAQIFINNDAKPKNLSKNVDNRDLKLLVDKGIGVHNAGLKRKDRNVIEKAFIRGELMAVVCTATLAWGINMPCHTVIIKGTDFYEPGVGLKPISLLDVAQIFGRAGRPQFDKYGEAVLITKAEDLNHFVGMLNNTRPIESQFQAFLKEGLLAEIVLGNASSQTECQDFIRSTFFYVRIKRNPTHYRVKGRGSEKIEKYIIDLVRETLRDLHGLRLVRLDEANDQVEATELGRIASHYYINCQTMERLCSYLKVYEDEDAKMKTEDIDERNLIGILAQASEFEQISSKPEEEGELMKLKKYFSWAQADEQYKAHFRKSKIKDKGSFDQVEKVTLLLWGYLFGQVYENYSLVADTNYVTQNAARVLRCMLDISLRQNNAELAERIVTWIRYIENCINEEQSPLRMFCYENHSKSVMALKNQMHEIDRLKYLSAVTIGRLEQAFLTSEQFENIAALRQAPELLQNLNLSTGNYKQLRHALDCFPLLEVQYEVKPIAQTITKLILRIKPVFRYDPVWLLPKENFWIFVSAGSELLHHGQIAIDCTQANLKPFQEDSNDKHSGLIDYSCFLPLREITNMYNVRVLSDRFVDADVYCDVSLKGIKVTNEKMEYTDLLDLQPLKIGALNNALFEKLFTKIKFFNPIQTQVFWPLYHTDENLIVGAPTGSGKTIIAELAILRVFDLYPKQKVVYIAPFKALVKERMKDWQNRFGLILGKSVQELTGDLTPDYGALQNANLLITTPEKWDGISRGWQARNYVTQVALMIFDEIHLLGQDRGPVIEVIVSRMNFISRHTEQKVRMIGLSTALANAPDVGRWFGIRSEFLFNFRPSVRPVPVEIHFRGFSEKNYCPRMNSMNKPAYFDIKRFSAGLPVLVFVSSRRQTRLTSLDLISLAANDTTRPSFVRMSDIELAAVMAQISDPILKETISFGVGMHHAGLGKEDRYIVEQLFESAKIQILVATSTLAWGVNFPAKLVIIKGTEFFDAKSGTYIDMPITDILQMVGRAGRPQFNDKGFACVYVEKSKKNFYRKYLNDPFPLESCFESQISEHINAEIASFSIQNKQQCVDYLTWTYFFRRVVANPGFYGLSKSEPQIIQKFLIDLVDKTCADLQNLGLIEIEADGSTLNPNFLGDTASKYYLKPKSVSYLSKVLQKQHTIVSLLETLSNVEEYYEVPVRHNEDQMNLSLSEICPYKIDKSKADNPKVKTFLLFQAYLSDLPLPIKDYATDTKLVLDSAFRVLQAIVDISAETTNLQNTLFSIQLMQMIVQGCWINQSSFINFPNMPVTLIDEIDRNGLRYLCQIQRLFRAGLLKQFFKDRYNKISKEDLDEIFKILETIPDYSFESKLFKINSETLEQDSQTKTKLKPGDEVSLQIIYNNENKNNKKNVEMKRMNKEKQASWFIIIGNFELNKLIAIKRCSLQKTGGIKIQFDIPNELKKDRKLEIFVMSDSYLGIDQKINIDLNLYISTEKVTNFS